ncbi:MAG TPA: nickel pincer cofactor biosynthesis protein LarB [Gemmatales bacterium]|nr:nickel pincer cofactor biosynthesis protein LarB [Gemmatales bacterium]
MSSKPVDPGTADLGFARIDLARQQRCGFPEVVYGEGKTVEGVVQIVKTLAQAQQGCLVTRVSDAQALALGESFPHAEQDRLGKTFWLSAEGMIARSASEGRVAIVTAGTADLPVAHEAQATLKAMGVTTDLIADVGVAGLHRLLAQVERIRQADVVIVVAGMEAALASVVGGLVACPVIGVPTSVGYGSHFGGLTALLGMLNSCAANVACVNIDAGFKAGYLAGLMVRKVSS